MTSVGPIKRVFIANRGEIAVRIVRACESLGLESVVGVSEADKDSLAAQLATKAVLIGPAQSSKSYLRPETLVSAAIGTRCQAVHPGYGFLSERASFASLCTDNGLIFIGPSSKAIQTMGDKISALRFAADAGIARVPGSDRVASIEDARVAAASIGYPILFKASAGGGGRGMRIVRNEEELAPAMSSASAEAMKAFGDGTLYIEKFVDRARHIEVQLLGDAQGNVVHLAERECSTQRRYQKLIEEGPSPVINAAMRQRLGNAAVTLAKRVGYQGAGTVEFVFDEDTHQYYFLEMNTRIQVEHPVTEAITGRDLVVEQIRIAAGEPISFDQAGVQLDGHAIECRINAEDPARNFAPSPGRISAWSAPKGAGIRVDSHCFPGYLVPPFYDSLLAKVIVHAADRSTAISKMRAVLDELVVEGVRTTVPFHQQVLSHDDFQSARVTTRWVEETFHAK